MKFISYFDAQEAFENDEEFKDRALVLIKKLDDESTYTGASAVSGLLNYWSSERELKVYERSTIVDDINDCYVTTDNPNLYAKATRVLYKSLKFDVKELTDKLRSEGFNVPAFLLAQAETVASDGTNKNINTNTIATTNLLKAPTRQDNWFDVIADMTTVFHNTHGKLPNEAQAWGQLWTLPPAGYAIKTGTDKGEDNLTMPGVSPLSKSAFFKRWKKYNPDKP